MPTNEYMKAYMANRRKQRRDKLIEMSGRKCAKCGNKESLEFNHKDRFDKNGSLSGAFLDRAWKTVIEEWEKCELLCTGCHLVYTQGQYDRKEILSWNSMKHLPYIHGTMRTYHETNCRCKPCKKAKKLYRNKLTTFSEVVQ